MNTTQIKSLYADFSSFDGKTVAICGWARTIRDSKNFGFIEPVSYTHLTLPTKLEV